MDQRATQQQTASPNGTAKLSNHSPADAHDWSGDERSSDDDDTNDRSQSGTSNKRKRPLSVSCETCSTCNPKGAPERRCWCCSDHCRAAQGQMRPGRARLFVVFEEPLGMRELLVRLTSTAN